MRRYKIQVIRSGLGRYTWYLLEDIYKNDEYTKIAEAPRMYYDRKVVDDIVKRLRSPLLCRIEFIDMEHDYE